MSEKDEALEFFRQERDRCARIADSTDQELPEFSVEGGVITKVDQ